MSKFNSVEYNILKKIPQIGNDIALYIETFIYKDIKINHNSGFSEEYTVKYDHKHGEYRCYFNNILYSKINFVNNKMNGVYTQYYLNSQVVSMICNYIDNNREGLYTEYYKNNNLKKQIDYKNDKMNGKYKEYYPYCIRENDLTGPIKISTSYIDNQKNGLYQEWHYTGKLNIKCYYAKGERI